MAPSEQQPEQCTPKQTRGACEEYSHPNQGRGGSRVRPSLWPSACLLTTLVVLGASPGLEQSHAASPVTFVPLYILDLRLLALLHVLQLRLLAAERDAALVREPESYRFVALFVYGRPHAEPLGLGIEERDRAKQYLLLRRVLTLLLRYVLALSHRSVLALLRFGCAVLLRALRGQTTRKSERPSIGWCGPGTLPARVELVHCGGGDLLHHPRLLRRQVLPPPAGPGLAAGVRSALLLLGGILPGVLLDHPSQSLLLDRNSERGVDLLQLAESVVPEILVPGRDLAPSVCLISLPRLPEARVVHPGPLPYELVRVGVGQSVLAGAPAPFFLGVQKRGDNISRVADEQDYTALGKGLYKERRTHRAVRFLYDQEAILAQLGEARVGPFKDERPQGSYPGPSVRVAEDVVLPSSLLLPSAHVISVAEHVSHVRFVPYSVVVQISHHGAEPATAGPRDAEDPDEVLGRDTAGGGIAASCGEARPQPGDLPVS